VTVEELFKQCSDLVKDYPGGTCKLGEDYPVAGHGFFPVASGSFSIKRVDLEISPRKLMFVGQDWGCTGGLLALQNDINADMISTTCRNLSTLLDHAGIPLDQCFFTNALFGVRSGNKSTGKSLGWECPKFIEQCKLALQAQVNAIEPRGVICLGRDAPDLLARMIEQCEPWKHASSFKQIDDAKKAVINLAPTSGPIVAAILLHPSFRKPNAKHRNYMGANGHDAEVAILKEIWRIVNQNE